MKKFASLLLVLAMLLSLSACGAQTAETAAATTASEAAATQAITEAAATVKDPKDITIGVTFQGLSDEYIVRLSNSFQAKAKEIGVNLIVSDGQMNAEKQVGQVENFIAQGVDVIVMNPISMDGCAPAVDAAVAAGIPILTLISITSNQYKATAYVGSDSVESGEIEAEMMVKDLGGKGNIVVMFGQMGHDAQIGRYQGLKNMIEGTDIKIVAEQTGNWSREEGMKLMENWLSTDLAIDAVVAQNDAMALGALQVLIEKGLTDQIKVYGIDAQGEALQAVADGTMAGTVFQNAELQGSSCVEVAVRCAQGETVDANNYIPYEAVRKADVPTYMAKLGM
jgi:inositol transport system substrate-binding protein